MRTISLNETTIVSGAGFLGITLGRVEDLTTHLGGALATTTLALNDTLFSVVQLQSKESPIQLDQLTKLV